MASNKKIGNDFEEEFAEMLSKEGWWVHLLAQHSYGQPADVLAVKKKKALLIDCKVCSKRGFAISRIEDNQHLAMNWWKQCDNGEAWFALKIPTGDIYMIPHYVLIALSNEKSILNFSDIAECGKPYERWVKKIK